VLFRSESFEKSQVDSASPYRLSLSIGITISDPHHFSSEDIIRKADLAMYKAKASQGEHIHLFTAENESNPLSDHRLFTALQQACEASIEPSRPDSFRILFQPIVNAAGEVLAVEALARWDHPDLGEVPPTLFIPVAEHYRIMGRVGWQLIKATLKTFKQLIQALKISPNQLDLAINISPSQLTDASFSGQLIDAIAAQGISCKSINLELTETAIFNSTAAVEINLRNCREAGMRISLDDFGTGFSSMGLLLSVKPDELKIDRSFVIGVLNDSYAEQIVDLLPRLTNSVSMTLVAEGVDTEDNFQRLQQMGVARFQGYLFSEPLNIAALVELVGGNRLTIPLPAV
jgi:EAL domain-containing protein (putative c-di-GMP-specific phosphodiesterase class I)